MAGSPFFALAPNNPAEYQLKKKSDTQIKMRFGNLSIVLVDLGAFAQMDEVSPVRSPCGLRCLRLESFNDFLIFLTVEERGGTYGNMLKSTPHIAQVCSNLSS